MSLVRVRDTLIGESVEYRYSRPREWRGECGCMLAAITTECVIIRVDRRIYRFARPLPQAIYAICSHGHEWILSESDAARILPEHAA